ncbi:hypothetical protein R3P38DRAFT_2784327 [Favolaschia claudopus]|uniref:Uncharacterized protein n=1 Tax=Favolaschia claudopus TaxID=2862362 RepID=A0AAW0AZ08_9AGAR
MTGLPIWDVMKVVCTRLSLTQRIPVPLFAGEFRFSPTFLLLSPTSTPYHDYSNTSNPHPSFFKMMTGTLVMEDLSVVEYTQARRDGIRVIPYRINDAHVFNRLSRWLVPS